MNNKEKWIFRIVTLVYCLYMYYYGGPFYFMILNVFLAYIPIEISFHLNIKNGWKFWLPAAFWLLFYPNAPYLLTDFIHLVHIPIYDGRSIYISPNMDYWWKYSILALGIIGFTIVGMDSINTISRQLLYKFKEWKVITFQIIVQFLSSLAIYVGRFDRLHSVYIFTEPVNTIKLIFFTWSQNKIQFILIMTFLQIGLFYFINFVRKNTEKNLSTNN
ncbi:DUF1361 domain-containing protein [Floricoccus penangensis]|nr:DUF1361 domain-containing protein [Floricoccus penangensis]